MMNVKLQAHQQRSIQISQA